MTIGTFFKNNYLKLTVLLFSVIILESKEERRGYRFWVPSCWWWQFQTLSECLVWRIWFWLCVMPQLCLLTWWNQNKQDC